MFSNGENKGQELHRLSLHSVDWSGIKYYIFNKHVNLCNHIPNHYNAAKYMRIWSMNTSSLMFVFIFKLEEYYACRNMYVIITNRIFAPFTVKQLCRLFRPKIRFAFWTLTCKEWRTSREPISTPSMCPSSLRPWTPWWDTIHLHPNTTFTCPI